MCRNIRQLHNLEPGATSAEVHDAALQYVRKVSGASAGPSRRNSEQFDVAVASVARATQELLDALVTTAPPRNRAVDAARARERSAQRFARPAAGFGEAGS